MGTASEEKYPYMAGHQRRVIDLTRTIATEMKLTHDKNAGFIYDRDIADACLKLFREKSYPIT
jgi:hypothetical protein